MNKNILFISLLFLCFSMAAQTEYAAGYYVNTSGKKVSGFIKNEQWSSNPNAIQFKSSDEGSVANVKMADMQSFEITGISKFIKATVNVDQSTENLNTMTFSKKPEYKNQTVILNVLSEGKASLYQYLGNGIQRFFYQLNQEPIEPLVYKKYLFDGKLKENNRYKQQLINAFQGCEVVSVNKIKGLRYKATPLAKLFDQYNSCSNVTAISYLQKGQNSDFNIKVKLGAGTASYVVEGRGTSTGDYGGHTFFRGEIEAEYVLPFNNNKWAIFIAVAKGSNYTNTIVSETGSSVNPTQEKTLTYEQGFETPIGVRHYFFLTNKLKLSLHAGYNFNYIKKIAIEKDVTSNSFVLENKVAGNFIIGAALHYSRIFVEARLDVGKDVIKQATFGLTSNNNVASLSLGYQFL